MRIKLLIDAGSTLEDALPLAIKELKTAGLEPHDSVLQRALEGLLKPESVRITEGEQPSLPEAELQMLRRQEFVVLRREIGESSGVTDLMVSPTLVADGLVDYVSKVHLVERLKETRAFVGFDRLEPTGSPEAGLPDRALKQLFLKPPTERPWRWLPAVEVYGEGIYIELAEEMIRGWQNANSDWLRKRLDDLFILRVAQQHQTLPPSNPNLEWVSRYLLVHTLAHVLLTEMVFECGYSTASLRERLYVSADPVAPMAGLLIYTAAGDSEGTLGGLVRLGESHRLERIFGKALERASWCSVDPICSEKLGGQGSNLANLAACHACALLPETACETINHGLDRAMLVGTPDRRDPGAFSKLLKATVRLSAT